VRFVLVVGTTETAAIEGISAAGTDPEAMRYTPAADAEIVEYGQTVLTPGVPVSPSGCPTPGLVTRAVRELVGFDLLVVDAGLAESTAAPTLSMPTRTGGDVRDAEPVPDAADTFEAARRHGRALPDDELVVGESIPGGTTTALGVLTALGREHAVSSSLPENPLSLKRSVVEEGLDASGVDAGDLAHRPAKAVALMGDPVLATVSGLVAGAVDSGTEVTLAGGTQMLAAAALVRHAGVTAPLTVATTSFVAEDASADVPAAAADLDVDLVSTDPGFHGSSHVAMERFSRGEAKEGVGMGGALALAAREGVPMRDVRDRIEARYGELVEGPEA
jgi:uncharacterized protein (TIGR00303 family)